jgi:hypothetical protein
MEVILENILGSLPLDLSFKEVLKELKLFISAV